MNYDGNKEVLGMDSGMKELENRMTFSARCKKTGKWIDYNHEDYHAFGRDLLKHVNETLNDSADTKLMKLVAEGTFPEPTGQELRNGIETSVFHTEHFMIFRQLKA